MAQKLISVPKQPWEELDYDFIYTDWLPSGDTVENADVVIDPVGLTITRTELSGQMVKVWVSGGTSGTKYKITCRMTTAQGRKKEDEIVLPVKEL